MTNHEEDSESAQQARVKDLQEKFAAFKIPEPSQEKLKPMRRLLETYSGMKPEDVLPHVLHIRQKAWDTDPYPCIGNFNFLDISIADSPIYDDVLLGVKGGKRLLDIGCCFGQDIRKLVSDGAPSENLLGCDVNNHFFGLGYDLFLDKDSLETRFFATNILKEHPDLDSLKGQINIVHTASLLHLFDREDQKAAIRSICKLLKAEAGVVCFGRQVGAVEPGYIDMGSGKGVFRHSCESFKEVWNEVALERGERWKVTAELGMFETLARMEDGETGKLLFSAERQ